MMEEKIKETSNPRRELLKKVGKTAVFVIPTLITFSIPSLAVAASGPMNDPYRSTPPGQK